MTVSMIPFNIGYLSEHIDNMLTTANHTHLMCTNLRKDFTERWGDLRTSRESSSPTGQKVIVHRHDPLNWWKLKELEYPRLVVLARRYLAIPASSASSERVFSTASDIVTKKRNRLLASRVHELVFLKKTLPLIGHDMSFFTTDNNKKSTNDAITIVTVPNEDENSREEESDEEETDDDENENDDEMEM